MKTNSPPNIYKFMGTKSGGTYIYQYVKIIKYWLNTVEGNTLCVSAELNTTVRS